MAKIKRRRTAILAKIEATPGVEETPDPATDAILTRNFQIEPLNGEELERELDKGEFGSDLATLVGKHVRVTFQVEIAGAGGAVDAVPKWSPLVQVCGHSETINATTNVTFDPIDSGIPTATIYAHIDKKLHKLIGARGLVTFSGRKREYNYFNFDLMGLFLPVSGSTVPGTLDLTGWTRPVPFRKSTLTASLMAQTLALHEWEVNPNIERDFYETSEEESIEIFDRRASMNLHFEEPEPATHNFYDDVDQENTGSMSLQIGTTAGNTVTISASTAQLTQISEEPVQDISALRGQGKLVPSGGNPDYQIVTT